MLILKFQDCFRVCAEGKKKKEEVLTVSLQTGVVGVGGGVCMAPLFRPNLERWNGPTCMCTCSTAALKLSGKCDCYL